MTNLNRKTLYAVILTSFVLSNSIAQEIIKLGHAGPLTGSASHLGKDSENGVRMAIDELNAKTNFIGGKKVQWVMQSEDDAGDPRQASIIAQRLSDAKVNAVIGHANSGATIPASQIYEDVGIPHITPSATSPKVTQLGHSTAFRVVASDIQLAAALGQYAIKNLKVLKIALIDDRSAYGQGLSSEFNKVILASNSSTSIISHQYTNDKATDFNAILTQIKQKNPDMIFFGGMDGVAGPMLRQMKALGIKAYFMGGDGICTETLLKLAGDAIENDQVICARAGAVMDNIRLAQFKQDFLQRFKVPVDSPAPSAYDAVMVIAEAIKQAKSSEPSKYLPYLKKINYSGVTGTISFNTFGDLKSGPLTLFTYRNGEKMPMTLSEP